ncbi:MAG: zeta toxin family protein [Gammaproteobacteria bacterium]|nr:zeta toxin family protein [Gammaproteobacteria bacterium]
MPKKQVIIIAGPNGAGKTTFASEYLPNEASCPIFINADLIAEELSPSQPEAAAVRAGRMMLEKIDGYARTGQSFALETTLSGRTYINRIRRWRADGYSVKLMFLSLKSPEEAIQRVELRVRQGGHSIPEEVIRRRFDSGLKNFRTIYCDCVDEWFLYDNSGASPIVLEQKEK